jgi:predicted lipid-binding transport protein (Tim44 family)
VVRLAHRHNVPVRSVATYAAKGVLKNLADLPEAAAQTCLADAVSDIEHAQAHARSAAQAWAVGDLKTTIAHYSRSAMAQCVEQTSSFTTLEARNVADTVAAVDAALAKPGKTVAIFALADLLRRDGALERLRAQPGVTVTAPDM